MSTPDQPIDGLADQAMALIRQGRAQDAAALLRAAPDRPDGWGMLGVALLNLEAPSAADLAAAEADLRRCIDAQPGTVWAHFNLVRCLKIQSRTVEAIDILRRVAALEPGLASAHYELAISLMDTDDLAGARAAIDRTLAIEPGHRAAGTIREELDRIERQPAATRRTPVRYPRRLDALQDRRKAIETFLLPAVATPGSGLLRAGQGIYAIGSCFAINLARSLTRFDLRVGWFMQAEDANSTFANRALLEWLLQGADNAAGARFAAELGESRRRQLVMDMKSAHLFILTVGAAACFFDRRSGQFAMPTGHDIGARRYAGEFEFRTTTVGENVSNLRAICGLVRRINPHCRIVVTVSPVPLAATFEFGSAVYADCLSKSTLRLAVHQWLTAAEHDEIYYWPSFEVVRWLGCHWDPVFGGHDGNPRHVDAGLVDLIVELFVERFAEPGLAERPAAIDQPGGAGLDPA